MKMKMSYVVTLLFALLVTGCGQAQSGGTGTASTNSGDAKTVSDSSKKVTISYAIWSEAQKPAMEEIARKFKETHPNIEVKVELTPFAQFWTQAEAGAAGGTMPDVFWMDHPNFIKYASNNIILPVTENVKKDQVDLDNYPKTLIDMYTYDNNLYTVPKDFDTIGLFYNKEMFKEKGVPFPDETWDWNTLLEASKKLTDPAKGVWGIIATNTSQGGYYNLIFQNGGTVLSDDQKKSGFDKPETIEALKFWADLIHVHKVSPTLAQMTDTPPMNLFNSGKAAMFITGSNQQFRLAGNEYIKDKFDVAVLPQGKQRATVIHGLANVISAKSKHPQEAWEWVKFMGGKEAAEIQAKTGAITPAYNDMQDVWVQAYPNYNVKAFLEMLPYAVPMPASKDTAKWADVQNEYMAKAFAGEMSIESASQEVAKQMNQLLSKE
jgi:multiple sugar transport system substrate-binding protein